MPGRKPILPASNSARTPPPAPSDRLGCSPSPVDASAGVVLSPSDLRTSLSGPATHSGVSVESRSQPPGRNTLTRIGASGAAAAWACAFSSIRSNVIAFVAYSDSPSPSPLSST